MPIIKVGKVIIKVQHTILYWFCLSHMLVKERIFNLLTNTYKKVPLLITPCLSGATSHNAISVVVNEV